MPPAPEDGLSPDTVQEQAALLDLASDAILVRDLDGVVRYWNHGAERLYGFTKAEAVGQRVWELLRSRYPEPLADIEASVRRTGGWEGELRQTNRRGEELVILSRWILRRNANGKPSGMLQSNLDVTERRQAQLQAQRLQELELAQAEHLATLGQIAAGLAHEIKNPLAGIAASLEVLSPQLTGQDEIMAEVRRQVERIRRLVDDLLHYARPRPLAIALGDLNLTVQTALHLLVLAAQQRQTRLLFAPGDLPPVAHDSDQVQSLVANLVLNAIQATSAGSGRVEVATRRMGGEAVIAVTDNGAGIGRADRDKIFQPFFTTKGDQGSGLGLALCRRIAELHGGRLEAVSEPQRGSTFTAFLPLAARGDTP